LHHQPGPLEEATGWNPSYAQIYFCDRAVAVAYCMFHWANHGCNEFVMSELTDLLCQFHQYFPLYKQACDVLHQQGAGNDVTVFFVV